MALNTMNDEDNRLNRHLTLEHYKLSLSVKYLTAGVRNVRVRVR